MWQFLRQHLWPDSVQRIRTEGRAYIHPVNRGIVFEDGEHADRYVTDIIQSLNGHRSGYGHLRITVEWEPEDNSHG